MGVNETSYCLTLDDDDYDDTSLCAFGDPISDERSQDKVWIFLSTRAESKLRDWNPTNNRLRAFGSESSVLFNSNRPERRCLFMASARYRRQRLT